MIIDSLYHWSPTTNRKDIRQNGLQISHGCLDGADFEPHYICLGTTPWRAWSLLPVDTKTCEIFEWDLWQVEIENNDKIQIRNDMGKIIQEIRVFNSICPSNVWFVGSREDT